MRILKLVRGKACFAGKVGKTEDLSGGRVVFRTRWGKQKICPGNDWFFGCMIGDEKSPPVGGLKGIFPCGLWPLSE